MNTMLYVLSGVILILVIFNLFNRPSYKNVLHSIRNNFLAKEIETVLADLQKTEIVLTREIIDEKEYIVVLTNTLKTIKMYVFENGLCSAFFVQTMEVIYSLPAGLNYEKEFNIIRNDNFDKGIDLSIANSDYNPAFFFNGLTVEIAPQRFAKIFRSVEYNSPSEFKPLYIYFYFVSISVDKIEDLIDFVKEDTLEVRRLFNRGKKIGD